MFDAAWPPASIPAGVTVAAGYVGAAPPAAHKWSLEEWRHAARLPGIRELLAIGVYSPGRDPVADAREHTGDAIVIAAACAFGEAHGNAIALDVEENVAAGSPAYVSAWANECRRLAFVPMVYTSASAAGFVPAGIDRWLAEWTGTPHLIAGSSATQYAALPAFDLSTVADTLPLWRTHLEGPTMPQYVFMMSDPLGRGYWVVSDNGGVFSYGVPFYGSMYGKHLDAPISSGAPAPDGKGYWLLGRDGGIFAFGSARYLGGPKK